jgi:putative membrane protein
LMGYGWGFMWIWPLFLVLIAIGIYYLIASSRSEHHSHSHRQYRSDRRVNRRAIEILNERYARGEITKEQFREMRNELD